MLQTPQLTENLRVVILEKRKIHGMEAFGAKLNSSHCPSDLKDE